MKEKQKENQKRIIDIMKITKNKTKLNMDIIQGIMQIEKYSFITPDYLLFE